MIVVLDSGVLGLLCSPRAHEENLTCNEWLGAHLAAGSRIILPEIVDYETRRALLHRNKADHLLRLDALHEAVLYLPITTPSMTRAAELWAKARKIGRKTASDKALDIDMILCAQAQVLLGAPDDTLVVATTNVRHLMPFIPAKTWREISPA